MTIAGIDHSIVRVWTAKFASRYHVGIGGELVLNSAMTAPVWDYASWRDGARGSVPLRSG